MPDVLFRLDAAAHLGMGHAYQSLALATALRELGLSSAFAVKEHDKEALEWLRSFGISVIPLPVSASQSEQIDLLLPTINLQSIKFVVVDHHELDYKFTRPLLERGIGTMVIDDEGKRLFECDVVVNYNFYANEIKYHTINDNAIFHTGPKYAILREQFLKNPGEKKGFKLLVTMGGGYARGIVSTVLEGISMLPPSILKEKSTTVILGPTFPDPKPLLKKFGGLAEIHLGVENMRDFMEKAAVAICGGGGTLTELARMGVPAQVVILDDNQRRIAASYERLSLGRVLGWYEDVTPRAIAETLIEWSNDPDQIASMADRAKALLDGKGAERVAWSIQEIIKKRRAQ